MKTRILLNGCRGKMGRMVTEQASESLHFEVVAGVDKFSSNIPDSFPVWDNLFDCTADFDCIIDFSRPDSLGGLLAFAQVKHKPLVIATTGLSADDHALIKDAARSVAIFTSANMSYGINLMRDLIIRAYQALGDSCDIEIVEKHHRQKVDAPSGTALLLANALNGISAKRHSCQYGRQGKNAKRTDEEIGIHAIRGGTIVGDHEILFIADHEVLSINHSAQSRSIFANGALRAAAFILGKPAGLYQMQDMFSEQNPVNDIQLDDSQALISLFDIPYPSDYVTRLFSDLACHQINLDIISQTAPKQARISLSFTLPKTDLSRAMEHLDALTSTSDAMVHVDADVLKITLEGPGMEHRPGVAARLMQALAERQIIPKSITTSETKITCIVSASERSDAINVLQKTFELM